jgi:hypothetical protein
MVMILSRRQFMSRLAVVTLLMVAPGGLAMAEGINLSWNDCGVTGAASMFHDCGNQSAVSELYGSFVPPPGITQFQGMEARLLISGPNGLPDWWHFQFLGCRDTSEFIIDSDYSASECVNAFTQPTVKQGYAAALLSPDRLLVRILITVADEDTAALDAAREYFAFRVRIKNAAPGTGSGGPCLGCEVPVCLTLASVELLQPPPVNNNPLLTDPVNRAHVTWQSDIVERCPFTVPVKSATWGQVRSLYR